MTIITPAQLASRILANKAARYLNKRPPFARTRRDRAARWLYFRAH